MKGLSCMCGMAGVGVAGASRTSIFSKTAAHFALRRAFISYKPAIRDAPAKHRALNDIGGFVAGRRFQRLLPDFQSRRREAHSNDGRQIHQINLVMFGQCEIRSGIDNCCTLFFQRFGRAGNAGGNSSSIGQYGSPGHSPTRKSFGFVARASGRVSCRAVAFAPQDPQ